MTGPRPVRVAFFGTPEVAVPALDALLADDRLEVVFVVTNPDRRAGRGKTLRPPPVKVAAEASGLRVLQPEHPRDVIDDLRAADVHAVAVVAYGSILRQDVLDAGGAGFVNLHFSLLPRWRGAAPVQHAIRNGDAETGVTCFVLDPGMDTGPILRTERVAIRPGEDAGSLLDRLADLGGPVLADALVALVDGEAAVPQPDEGVTMAPKITTADVRIDPRRRAGEVANLIRSAAPRPGAWTIFRGRRLKVLEALTQGTAVNDTVDVGAFDDQGRLLCATGALELLRVQPEGKPPMDGAAFVNGYRPAGERIELPPAEDA